MDTTDDDRDLLEVLDDLGYPADTWQVIACAEIHGVDLRTRRDLYDLPARAFHSAEDITTTLSPHKTRPST